MLVRLQKIMADRGYCSRRTAEDLISSGKVKVDGILVTELGNKYEEDTCVIDVNGRTLKPKESGAGFHYVLINKPLGFICTLSDTMGRKTVDLLVPREYGRLFPVGRLDINSSGALILTDDGDFANLVMHPSSSFPKTYLVTIDGLLKAEHRRKLQNGIMLEDGMTAPAEVRVLLMTLDRSRFEITIHEGKNREVRRMVQALGFNTISLSRIAIGPIKLDGLPSGAYDDIPLDTIEKIKKICLANKATNTYVKK